MVPDELILEGPCCGVISGEDFGDIVLSNILHILVWLLGFDILAKYLVKSGSIYDGMHLCNLIVLPHRVCKIKYPRSHWFDSTGIQTYDLPHSKPSSPITESTCL